MSEAMTAMSYERTLLASYAAARQRLTAPPRAKVIELPPPPPPPKPAPPEPTSSPMTPADAIRDVIAEVARKHLTVPALIVGMQRWKPVVAARHEAAFRLVIELGLSYPAAARHLRRNHTTIMHSVRTHAHSCPEAALALKRFYEAKGERREALTERVLRMHFEGQKSAAYISRKCGTSRELVKTIIAAELQRISVSVAAGTLT